jgi:hypothetical protein
MKYLKMIGLAAIAAAVLMAIVGASAASATTLEVEGVTKNASVSIVASLTPGTSALLKDSAGTTTDTCTTSEVKGATESPFTGSTYVGGIVSSLTFGNCSHTTTVLKPGKLDIDWDGGTNGTVISTEAEVTVVSTAFGISAVCKTGAGTDIGTLTGVKTGHALMHINGKISCGILGTSTWTGSYTVTSPTGLGVEN